MKKRLGENPVRRSQTWERIHDHRSVTEVQLANVVNSTLGQAHRAFDQDTWNTGENPPCRDRRTVGSSLSDQRSGYTAGRTAERIPVAVVTWIGCCYLLH
jgi:hypothetical protein